MGSMGFDDILGSVGGVWVARTETRGMIAARISGLEMRGDADLRSLAMCLAEVWVEKEERSGWMR